MASNYTTNYELPIWAADDAFLRTEFNEANQKIDGALAGKADTADVTVQVAESEAALTGQITALAGRMTAAESQLSALAASRLRMTAGSYTGTGSCGSAHPNTLTFDFPPKLVVITVGDAHSVLLSPNTQAAGYHEAYTRYGMLKVTWSGNSVSWYVTGYYNGALYTGSGGDAEQQLNESGVTYHYLALG